MALKYDRHLDAVGILGAAMAELVDRTVCTVTWAPTSAPRRHRRGFDQAEVLARAVAASIDRPCVGLLQRTTTTTQVGHRRAERLRGPSFHTRGRARVAPTGQRGPVLVVDDVRTTGATLCAAAEALWSAGLGPVLGLTLSVRR
jgi:predicted amidophosphoribosyltransferase